MLRTNRCVTLHRCTSEERVDFFYNMLRKKDDKQAKEAYRTNAHTPADIRCEEGVTV